MDEVHFWHGTLARLQAGIAPAGSGQTKSYNGSELRIRIVYAGWNMKIIEPLVQGTKKALRQAGVKDENVVVTSVPGSYELPYAVARYVFK